jgi:hypothetical protein
VKSVEHVIDDTIQQELLIGHLRFIGLKAPNQF